jgi:hypothetical protein
MISSSLTNYVNEAYTKMIFYVWKISNEITSARFVVLTAVTIKSTIFWDMTPYSLVEVHRGFKESYCFHLQGLRVSQASKFQALATWSPTTVFINLLVLQVLN